MKKVLISGGSGLVGSKLTELLISQGVEVRWLSTRKNAQFEGIKVFTWKPSEEWIEKGALEGVDTVFHLAGANVAQRWTRENKQAILESRTLGSQTLYKAIESLEHRPTSFISASAVGYYPSHEEELYTENANPANDFLGSVVQAWENEVDKISNLNVRVVKLRIGIVLALGGGVLGQMVTPFKWGLGSPLGNGKQWMPWIHVKDLARMFVHAAQNSEMTGAYNASVQHQVRNKEFGKQLAKVLHRPYFFPAVPGWALKLVLGDMAQVALMSTHVSVEKMTQSGFKWNYTDLHGAIQNVLEEQNG